LDITRIDYWATSGKSVIHKSSPISKIVATAMVIASVIITRDLGLLACLYLTVLLTARLSMLPVRYIIAISLLPAAFTILYAFSQSSGGWMLPAVIIMKALTAASAMILLISTTPYTEVVNLIGRWMPQVIKDGLFMTYRSFFILLGLMNNFLIALRLRGGLSPRRVVNNIRNMAAGVGMLFIRAYEKSQMLYDVMSIRGYSGKLSAERGLGKLGLYDLPYLLITAAFLLVAIFEKGPLSSRDLAIFLIILLASFTVMEAFRYWKKSSV
jgi:cobalt/nickel transport system permease protein